MTESAKITFYPLRIEGEVPKGITILEAARKCGISVESPCGGTGKCGRDIVQIRINKTLDMVLACKTVVETDMEVALPSQEKDDMKIIDGFFTKDSRQYNMNTSVTKELISYGNGIYSTRVYANDKLIATEEGDTQSCMYGIALDIGTTTLVASLVDLHNGNILENSSVLNPLVYYGHDVISRIKHSLSHKDGLFRMHVELISAVNFLITCLLSLRGIKHENIYQVIAAGNTTMQHIFLNKEIKGIGEYPYTAETLDTFTTTAKELAIAIAEYAPVTTFPCFSAYVGGDIVSGLLAIHYDETLELPSIFLDIGTNGEMVLFLGNQIVATSTAAGPCFEGVSISSGMRASMGAIEHVRFAENLSFDVIGGGKPSGICGSGLVETVSELVRVGLVNSMGRLQNKASGNLPTKYQKYLFDKNGKRHFRLTDDVSISQEDIRQVQLAKAAIRSGIEILLTAHNLKPEDLKTVIIAGAFGHHLSKESLFGIGILPALKHAKFSFVGNSSLEGAVQALLNKKLVNDASQIARAVQVMELSQFPTFEDIFVKEMHF